MPVGSKAVVRVMCDPAQGPDKLKITEAWREQDFEADQAVKRVVEAAEEAETKATETRRKAEQVARKLQAARMSRPPGLSSLFGDTNKGNTSSTFGT